MEILPSEMGNLIICDSCFGHYISESKIIELHGNDPYSAIEKVAKKSSESSIIECIKCRSKMVWRNMPFPKKDIQVATCKICNVLWFNKDDIEDAKPLECDMDRLFKEEKVIAILEEMENEKLIQAKLAEENLNIWHSNVKMRSKQLDQINDFKQSNGDFNSYLFDIDLSNFDIDISFD
ncbi:MAG: hypothetical protein JJT78_13820 [Leptospira sp.]|nr:hypothetical protein [Leptospira sp.]